MEVREGTGWGHRYTHPGTQAARTVVYYASLLSCPGYTTAAPLLLTAVPRVSVLRSSRSNEALGSILPVQPGQRLLAEPSHPVSV